MKIAKRKEKRGVGNEKIMRLAKKKGQWIKAAAREPVKELTEDVTQIC